MSHLFFKDISSGAPWMLAPTIPLMLFALFQLMFAIITPGLVVGAVAERIRFTSYVLFILLFSIFVYAPIAHWTWHPDGFLFKWEFLILQEVQLYIFQQAVQPLPEQWS